MKVIKLIPLGIFLNFILCSFTVAGQNVAKPQPVILSGKITSAKHPEGVAQVIIQVRDRYGLIAQDTSGPNGDYRLKLFADSTFSIEFAKPYPLALGENLQYQTTFKAPGHDFVLNVQLNIWLACGGKDLIVYFKKGSAEIDRNYQVGKDTTGIALDGIITLLKDNPTLVIEIASHQGIYEQADSKLSIQRAQAVYDYILVEGIESDRLIPKSYGRTGLRFTEKEMNKLKTSQEKEEMDKRNRRVDFRVIRTDFVPPKNNH